MRLKAAGIIFLFFTLVSCNFIRQNKQQSNAGKTAYPKLEMNLSAFGVESDGAPYIRATIDFANDSSLCQRWYDAPARKDSSWSLTKEERTTVLQLLLSTDMKALPKEYTALMTDQLTSTMSIYTGRDTIRVNDYGLIAQYPLSEMYKIVYKLHINFR
jgi:hypothetical protein